MYAHVISPISGCGSDSISGCGVFGRGGGSARRWKTWMGWMAAFVVFCGVGCASPRTGQVRGGASSAEGEVGVASYYAHKYHGRKTASGETYNMHEMTAAHRRLPFGTKVRVTNLNNDSSVVVRINDRGPFVKGRVIDLSLAAARKLDMVRAGVARVEIVPVSGGGKGTVAGVGR